METELNGNKTGVYQEYPGGPFKKDNPGGGRDKETEDDKLRKKALQVIVEEYKEKLFKAVNGKDKAITDKLVEKALLGDLVAIKEINDRLLGKSKTILAGDEENPLRVITIDKELAEIYGITTPKPEDNR